MKIESLRLLLCLAIGWAGAIATSNSNAQGTFAPVVMRTGGGVLTTHSVNYTTLQDQPTSTNLTVYFGFATKEAPQPSQFFDSFTISVSGPGGILYLATADAGGVLWAPTVPGAIPLLPGDIVRQSTSFLVPDEGVPPIAAYQMTYGLPATWWGVPLAVNFDLFDNQNLLGSLAYFYTVQVPEPSGVTLLLAGLAALCFGRSRSSQAK